GQQDGEADLPLDGKVPEKGNGGVHLQKLLILAMPLLTSAERALAMICNPAWRAHCSLISSRSSSAVSENWTIPPSSRNWGVSPTVSVPARLPAAVHSAGCSFSDRLRKRIWQDARSAMLSRRCTTILCLPTALSRSSRLNRSSASSPRTPMTMGESCPANFASGHWTNLARLKINAALRSYSSATRGVSAAATAEA